MLTIDRDPATALSALHGAPRVSGPASADHLRLGSLPGLLLRRPLLTSAVLLSFLLCGAAYIGWSTPLYTATTQILIDARRNRGDSPGNGNRSLAELGMDPASIDSQVAVLSSDALAIGVIKAFGLGHAPSLSAPTAPIGKIVAAVKVLLGRPPRTDEQNGVLTAVLDSFLKRLSVKRIQQTYVIAVSFEDQYPNRAAAIANAIASGYADGQVRADLAARASASSWLKSRMGEVSGEVAAAEQALRSARMEESLPGGSIGAADRQRLLEHDLGDKRALYQALVERSSQLLQQQSMPVSTASVLGSARLPERPSQPNAPLILTLSAMSGLAAAATLALWLGRRDGTFRLPSQIEAELRLDTLCLLPQLGSRRFPVRPPQTGRALRAPASRFSSGIKAVKAAVDRRQQGDGVPMVGVVSAGAGEGRSTVASELADVLAASGRRVLLVDADLRDSALSRARAPTARHGMLDVVAAGVRLADAVVQDDLPGLHILAAHDGGPAADWAALDAADFNRIHAAARGTYDYVVMDLPPLCAMAQTISFPEHFASLLLVVAWGRTKRSLVLEALAASPAAAERVIGVVLNGVDLRAVRRFQNGAIDAFRLAARPAVRASASLRAPPAGDRFA